MISALECGQTRRAYLILEGGFETHGVWEGFAGTEDTLMGLRVASFSINELITLRHGRKERRKGTQPE